jgi:hypothetical protein
MNFSRIKQFLQTRECCMGLSLLVLFLGCNIFYLKSITAQRMGQVASINTVLEEYQDRLQQQEKGRLPATLKNTVTFGPVLALLADSFGASGTGLQLSDIHVIEEAAPVRAGSRKATPPKRYLSVKGTSGSGPQQESYTRLNQVIADIQSRSGCHFSLQKASVETKKEANLPVIFELRLNPKENRACQKYMQNDHALPPS